MKLREVSGTHGSGKTPCTVFVAVSFYGWSWYCVDGSKNVNCTYDPIEYGVDVEALSDIDTFTAGAPIESLKDLETAINS